MYRDQILVSAFDDDCGSNENDCKNLLVDVQLSVREKMKGSKVSANVDGLDDDTRRNQGLVLRQELLDPNKHPFIDSVHMSIASHPRRVFSQSPLDDYQRLLNMEDEQQQQRRDHHHDPSFSSLSSPPGFSITIQPIGGLKSRAEEALAVNTLVHDWIQKRILTTPLLGGMWDVVEGDGDHDDNDGRSTANGKRRKYQIIMPFDGSAWSADALSQSFRATFLPPSVLCQVKSISKTRDSGEIKVESLQIATEHANSNEQPRFFGWSSFEWSQLLVGEGAPLSSIFSQSSAAERATYSKAPVDGPIMFYPSYKQMWWTIRRSQERYDSVVTEFGIRYQSRIPSSKASSSSSWKSLIPTAFWDRSTNNHISQSPSSVVPSSLCSNYRRPQIKIVTSKQLHSLIQSDVGNNNSTEGLNVKIIPFNTERDRLHAAPVDPVIIHQVIRRHSTHYGRFESHISVDSSSDSSKCKLMYRQIIPSFMTPSWQSLLVTTHSPTQNQTIDTLYSSTWSPITKHSASTEEVKASVKWNTEQHNSVLHVTIPNNGATLPSEVTITMEYEPTFLSLDEFPGDPNRGQIVPPGRVTKWCTDDRTAELFYSNASLLIPPVPDLSMPFNVISLTSSLYAYMIGTLITILVRKASERIKYKMYPEKKPKPALARLKSKIRSKLSFFSRKKKVSEPSREN